MKTNPSDYISQITIREKFSIEILKSIVNKEYNNTSDNYGRQNSVDRAVDLADKLIKKLNE